jgi:Tol biopolymer transport system component
MTTKPTPPSNQLTLATHRSRPRLGRGVLASALGSLLTFALSLVTQGANDTSSGQAGTKIVFQSDRDGNLEIYSMDSDGTNVTRLTNDPAIDVVPSLSHDGSKIAFVSSRGGQGSNIYLMNMDGSDVEQLTFGYLDENPAWSPDDQQIAYESLTTPDFEIGIVNADGSGAHLITNHVGYDIQPNWFIDGTTILFSRDYQIAMMRADGSGLKVLTNIPGYNEWPHWSPNGKKIVFHSTESGNYQIYVMCANGSHVTRLTYDNAVDAWAVWSPDGRSIAFQSDLEGNTEIYSIDKDGGNLTQLTRNPAFDGFPSWGTVRPLHHARLGGGSETLLTRQ